MNMVLSEHVKEQICITDIFKAFEFINSSVSKTLYTAITIHMNKCDFFV